MHYFLFFCSSSRFTVFHLVKCITASFPSVLPTGALCLPDLWPPFPPWGQTRGYLRCSPALRCDWWSSDQVGSASLSLHNNILVLSPEHMGPPAPGDKGDSCLETFDHWFWAPFFTDHTQTHSSDLQKGQMGPLAVQTLTEEINWLVEDLLCLLNQRNILRTLWSEIFLSRVSESPSYHPQSLSDIPDSVLL